MNPFLLALLLIGIVTLVLTLERVGIFERFFYYLPAAFWCYMLPMILGSLHLLPGQSLIYDLISRYLLPACLLLLLIGVDVPAIWGVGPMALQTMIIGTIGIGLGAVVSYAIVKSYLPDETWKAVGALSASWTGGSANMLAVKEALQAPDAVFAPMIVVDTLTTYTWMALLIALSRFQSTWDRWVQATPLPPELDSSTVSVSPDSSVSWVHAIWLLPFAMGIAGLCYLIGHHMPWKGEILTTSAWSLILVTTLGIVLSMTPARKLETCGASRIGMLCLYLLLASLGSKAKLQSLFHTPVLIGMAIIWVSIHAGILIIYGKLRRIPLFFLVASSQANIGGAASAPIVCGIYQPKLASVGLLLAIGANVFGTYIGLAIAQLCHWVSGS